MNIVKSIEEITEPFTKGVITIGNFDGVHLGHQSLLHIVVEKAHNIGGTALAMTFDPHPIRVLKPNHHPPLITLMEQKIELISKTGIDFLICVPFDKQFADITADQFIRDLLIKRIGMESIIVGHDYTFGKNREGNLGLLEKYAGLLGFEIVVADWIKAIQNGNTRISSTVIRELVIAGKVEQAQKILGRNYQIRGVVTSGRKRGGRLLGFPTANINLVDELCPKSGVYAVLVEHNKKTYQGVANIGYSPTFDDNIFTVEVHILDFDQNIYDEQIKVDFVHHLRSEIKFSNIDELAAQIKKDIIKARSVL